MKKDTSDKKHSRYLGCLFGGAVGDALGYPVEFLREERIEEKYGPEGIRTLTQGGVPAKISDDTQMTLFAANALISQKTNQSMGYEECLAGAYGEWLATQGEECGLNLAREPRMWIYEDRRLHALRAPGNTCMSSLIQLTMDDYIHPAKNNSCGCGTVMRAAPFGLAEHFDPQYSFGDAGIGVYKMASLDAMLTHGHPLARASSAALAHIVFRIVQYWLYEYNGLQDVIRGCIWGEPELKVLLDRAVELALDDSVSDLDAIHELGEGWVAHEALAIAVFCAVRYQDDFAAAIRAAVNHKGDSDSTGAICGNILGAWLGIEAVEAAFDLDDLELKDVITEIAEDLYRVVEVGIPEVGEDVDWDRKYRLSR